MYQLKKVSTRAQDAFKGTQNWKQVDAAEGQPPFIFTFTCIDSKHNGFQQRLVKRNSFRAERAEYPCVWSLFDVVDRRSYPLAEWLFDEVLAVAATEGLRHHLIVKDCNLLRGPSWDLFCAYGAICTENLEAYLYLAVQPQNDR